MDFKGEVREIQDIGRFEKGEVKRAVIVLLRDRAQ